MIIMEKQQHPENKNPGRNSGNKIIRDFAKYPELLSRWSE
jgi:hypothetical protein